MKKPGRESRLEAIIREFNISLNGINDSRRSITQALERFHSDRNSLDLALDGLTGRIRFIEKRVDAQDTVILQLLDENGDRFLVVPKQKSKPRRKK